MPRPRDIHLEPLIRRVRTGRESTAICRLRGSPWSCVGWILQPGTLVAMAPTTPSHECVGPLFSVAESNDEGCLKHHRFKVHQHDSCLWAPSPLVELAAMFSPQASSA